MAVVKSAIFSNYFRPLIFMNCAQVSLKILLSVVLASLVLPALASNDDGGQGDISYSHISIFGHVGEGVFDADFKGRHF